jgi:hypothetical protein
MARKSRVDAPEALQRIIIRGIEDHSIFVWYLSAFEAWLKRQDSFASIDKGGIK